MSINVPCFAGKPATISFAQDSHTLVDTIHHSFRSSDHDSAMSRAVPKIRGVSTPHEIGAISDKILRSFNTWAFKREQPSDVKLMLSVISDAVAAQLPVPFVLYWGKGPRNTASTHEAQCLDFLSALTARIQNAYSPGVGVTLILTDTHAELNGHSREAINQYFDEIKWLAEQRDFDTCLLGQLVASAGSFATAAPVEEIVSAESLSMLTASAAKWYRGEGSVEQGALRYLRMNLIEQRVVERAFARSIFITFNGSDLRCLFPRQLPIFYMYSLRRGVSVKPWFLPSEPMKSIAHSDVA
jgi:L-tyrosine isonitrile synthase